MTVGLGPVGNELELPRRADAEGMTDGGLDHRAGSRQELVEDRPADRRQLAVLVAGVEVVALREAGADIAHGEVLAPHLDARRGDHRLQQASGKTLVQREDHHADLGERAIVAAELSGQRLPGFVGQDRAIAAEFLEGGVIVGALRLPPMHPLRQRAIRQAQELWPHAGKVALLALACHRHAAFFSTMSMTRARCVRALPNSSALARARLK